MSIVCSKILPSLLEKCLILAVDSGFPWRLGLSSGSLKPKGQGCTFVESLMKIEDNKALLALNALKALF